MNNLLKYKETDVTMVIYSILLYRTQFINRVKVAGKHLTPLKSKLKNYLGLANI